MSHRLGLEILGIIGISVCSEVKISNSDYVEECRIVQNGEVYM